MFNGLKIENKLFHYFNFVIKKKKRISKIFCRLRARIAYHLFKNRIQ